MPLSFERSVRAIAAGMAGDSAEAAGDYLLATHARMPDHLRLAVGAATLLLDAWPIVATGRPFHRLEPPVRDEQLRAWEASRVPQVRALLTFYRKLATYADWSERCAQPDVAHVA